MEQADRTSLVREPGLNQIDLPVIDAVRIIHTLVLLISVAVIRWPAIPAYRLRTGLFQQYVPEPIPLRRPSRCNKGSGRVFRNYRRANYFLAGL